MMCDRINYIRDGRAPVPDMEFTSKTMSSIRATNSKPELLLRKALRGENIKGYRLHWRKVPGRPDIAFPAKKIAIFVNGCFWHQCPLCRPKIPKTHSEFWVYKFRKNVERDKQKNDQLVEKGWKSITIWECQIKKNLNSCVDKIKETLEEMRLV